MRPTHRSGAISAVAIGLVLVACGDTQAPPPKKPDGGAGAGVCPAGSVALDGGGCLEAGMQSNGCAAGEALVDGTCQPGGIPPAACGEGFEPDETRCGGCRPVLPDARCPSGEMAIPGDSVCRKVAPCGTGKWGDIPVDGATQFVDAAYGGADSDGTQGKPWTTIQDAVDAAAPGAIVAVASGSYQEDVSIEGHAVRLWGICPELTGIVGSSNALGAIFIRPGADETEIHGLGVAGTGIGIVVSGAENVVVDQVWIHGTGNRGLDGEDPLGTTSVALMRSLVEESHDVGVYVGGATVSIEATVIRDTKPVLGTIDARGLTLEPDPAKHQRASASLTSSVIEGTLGFGVYCTGSDVVMNGSVVRDIQPAVDGTVGRGVHLQFDPDTLERASASIAASLVENAQETGIFVGGSDATIEATVVRGTRPGAAGKFGYGIDVQDEPSSGDVGQLTVRSSAIDHNSGAGLFVGGSVATIEGSRICETQANAEPLGGAGIAAEYDVAIAGRANLTTRATLVEASASIGILVRGSDATIDGTAVRDGRPAPDGTYGLGIAITGDGPEMVPSHATISSSTVDGNLTAGIVVAGANAELMGCLARATAPQTSDGGIGDGLLVATEAGLPARAVVSGSRIENNARAGISVFGGEASIDSTLLSCNAFHLDGEEFDGATFTFDDGLGNVCGCSTEVEACKVLSSGFQPPAPLPPGDP